LTIDGLTELVQNLIPIFICDGFGCVISVAMLGSLFFFNAPSALISVRIALPMGPKHLCSDAIQSTHDTIIEVD